MNSFFYIFFCLFWIERRKLIKEKAELTKKQVEIEQAELVSVFKEIDYWFVLFYVYIFLKNMFACIDGNQCQSDGSARQL